MTKVAIINDTHFGVRNDNRNFYEYFRKFYSNVFFPEIDERDIKHLVHLGDLVDRRKYIQYLTSGVLHDIFMKPIFDRELDFSITAGNHDTQYRHTNEHNAIKALYGHSKYDFKVYERPETVDLAGTRVLMMPWICADTYDESIAEIESTDAQVLMGHLELSGFEMDRGHIADHGLSGELFSKFDMVLSGHYHHKSSIGNIHYLGSPAQFTWADYDDVKGFHIFDTETRELEFVRNPYEVFKKFFYNDSTRSSKDMLDFDESIYDGTYVKIVVKNKNDASLLDNLISKIDAGGATDIQVVEDHLNLDSISEDDLVDEAQDTISMLKKFIGQIDTPIEKKKIENFVKGLYEEALTIE